MVKIDNYFIDVTKIEANANKYTYVWSKSLNRNKLNTENKIKQLILQIDSITGETISKEQKDLIKKSNLIKLIYVAMTRAKHTLNLSFIKTACLFYDLKNVSKNS